MVKCKQWYESEWNRFYKIQKIINLSKRFWTIGLKTIKHLHAIWDAHINCCMLEWTKKNFAVARIFRNLISFIPKTWVHLINSESKNNEQPKEEPSVFIIKPINHSLDRINNGNWRWSHPVTCQPLVWLLGPDPINSWGLPMCVRLSPYPCLSRHLKSVILT